MTGSGGVTGTADIEEGTGVLDLFAGDTTAVDPSAAFLLETVVACVKNKIKRKIYRILVFSPH